MSQLRALTLAQLMTYGLVDGTAFAGLFSDVVQDLGRADARWLTDTLDTSTTTPGTGTYSVPTSTARLVVVAYEGRVLSRETVAALDAWDRDWRDLQGQPTRWLVEDEHDRVVRLVPAPISAGTVTYLGTQRRGDGFGVDTPARFDLPIALLTLQREFERESNHRDVPFSELCRSLAVSLLGMLS